MMNLYYGNCVLKLQTINQVQGSRKQDTAYNSYFLKSKSNLSNKMGIIKSIGLKITPPELFYDWCAGMGVGTALFKNLYKDTTFILNDLSKECVSNLKYNFPNDEIHNEDVLFLKNIDVPTSMDSMVWFDFGNFSWTKKKGFKDLLNTAYNKCDRLLLTDSTVYGLSHFGKTNYKILGIESIEGYFNKLQSWLKGMGWFMVYVSYFNNASLIYCEKKPNVTFEILQHQPIDFFVSSVKGLL